MFMLDTWQWMNCKCMDWQFSMCANGHAQEGGQWLLCAVFNRFARQYFMIFRAVFILLSVFVSRDLVKT